MSEQKNKLKVIRILDPILCVRCDNAYIADVVMSNGRRKKMFYCSRLDCDNWLSEKEAAQSGVENLDTAA